MVEEGQIIGYVETVGLKTEIKSTVSGKVAEILLEDGDIADYGKPVIRVEL
jgi:acetyl-CoA carboxylase biotin carboxyl carrier protein